MIKPEELEMTDYFADRLLEQLDTTDQAVAAFEAQDESRKVGFDFDGFSDVVPRALDEVREAREAREEANDNTQANGREHYGDEIADLMFSSVNLARLGGMSQDELPTYADIASNEGSFPKPTDDPEVLMSSIEAMTNQLAELFTDGSADFASRLRTNYAAQMAAAVRLARLEGYEPDKILRENVRKYLTRCSTIEALAKRDGKQWTDLHAAGEIVAYWKKAKAVERGQATLETA